MLKRAKEKGELIRGKISNSNSSSNNILYDDWDSLLKCPNWDSSELKRNRKELIRRRRIPPNIRGDVWLTVSKAKQNRTIDYRGLVTSFQGLESEYTEQIEKDLKRTFPENKLFESEEGIGALRRVLVTYSWVNPEIGYCQSMNFICAIFLLYMEEEDAFWLLKATIEEILPPEYYTVGMVGLRADVNALSELIEHKIPKIALHFQKVNIELKGIISNWFLSLFVNNLPLDATLRVFDGLFSEGPKILHKISLSLLLIHKREILRTATMEELYSYLLKIPQSTSTQSLFKLSYNKETMGQFNTAYVNSIRDKYWKALKFDFISEMDCEIKIINAPLKSQSDIPQVNRAKSNTLPNNSDHAKWKSIESAPDLILPIETLIKRTNQTKENRKHPILATNRKNTLTALNFSPRNGITMNSSNPNLLIFDNYPFSQEVVFPPPPKYQAPPVPIKENLPEEVPTIISAPSEHNITGGGTNLMCAPLAAPPELIFEEIVDSKYAKRFRHLSAIFNVTVPDDN